MKTKKDLLSGMIPVPDKAMSRFKANTWLSQPRVMGVIIFLFLSAACFCFAWLINDHKFLQAILPVILPVLILCATSAILIVYIRQLPAVVQKSTLKRTTESEKNGQRNKAIVNALPDMVFIIDREGRYIDFNCPPGQRNVVNPDDFLLKKVTDILPRTVATEAMIHIEKVLQTGQPIHHSYQTEVNGDLRSYESRYVTHTTEDVMVLVRDTTDTKIAEQNARENEEKYRMLVEQATDSIFIANFQGNFLVVNPASCKMSQYTAEELLTMRFHDLAIADELMVMPFKLAEIASGKTVTSERKMRRKDGKIVDVEVSARIIAPNRFLAFVRDITERKKAEDELLKSRESLRLLTNYIENIREEERLTIAKEIHDGLGQELTVLKMDVSGLGKKINAVEAGFEQEINELLEMINRMIETVRKISSDLRPGILDDIGLIATLDWYCQEFSKRTGIRTSFISDISDDNFPQRITINVFRIFQESLANLARHSLAGKADVSLKYRGQKLIVQIEDDGKGPSGFKHDDKPEIQIMKERAMMMNGTYNINNIPGQGTVIEVAIPVTNNDFN